MSEFIEKKSERYIDKVRRYEREMGRRWSDWRTPKGQEICKDLLSQLEESNETKKTHR